MGKRRNVTAGRVIAELNLGFWNMGAGQVWNHIAAANIQQVVSSTAAIP
ncbi:MAG: hypothetical protein J6M01_03825 [Prevotella sp.]|nr:hypothetical protein [Prevotella sp.]